MAKTAEVSLEGSRAALSLATQVAMVVSASLL